MYSRHITTEKISADIITGGDKNNDKILTVGITCHLGSDVQKLAYMIRSLYSTISNSSAYFNKRKFDVMYSAIEFETDHPTLLHDRVINENVELLINIDMKTNASVNISDIVLDVMNGDDMISLSNKFHDSVPDAYTILDPQQIANYRAILNCIAKNVNKVDVNHVRIIHTINPSPTARVSIARNNIVRHATGKYICFRDDDDMSVNINELVVLIAAAEHFKNRDEIKIMDLQKWIHANDNYSKKPRSKRPRRANKNGVSRKDCDYRIRLDISSLLKSPVKYIECCMLKMEKKYLMHKPMFTVYYPTNVIVDREWLIQKQLMFNENTVAEDTFWRFNMYYEMYKSCMKKDEKVLLPRPIYGIYEKSTTTTNKKRDMYMYESSVESIMQELMDKNDGKIPLLIPHFTMCSTLIEKQHNSRWIVRYMLNRDNVDKFVFGKYLREIAEWNQKRVVENPFSHDLMLEIPNKVLRDYKKVYKMDSYTVHLYMRLRNVFGVEKFFMEDSNYEINALATRFDKTFSEISGVDIYGRTLQDRYNEDCLVSEKGEIGESVDRNKNRLCYLFTPLQLLTWIEQTRICEVIDLLKQWGVNENIECDCGGNERGRYSDKNTEEDADGTLSDEFIEEVDEKNDETDQDGVGSNDFDSDNTMSEDMYSDNENVPEDGTVELSPVAMTGGDNEKTSITNTSDDDSPVIIIRKNTPTATFHITTLMFVFIIGLIISVFTMFLSDTAIVPAPGFQYRDDV